MKIGILTFYHNSVNYGGVLQAYALVEFLKQHGYDAEQIDYIFREDKYKETTVLKKILAVKPKYIFKYLRTLRCILRRKLHLNMFIQYDEFVQKQFYEFRNNKINHSNITYDNHNINNSNKIYDAFIVGSDQVWNLNWDCGVFFLPFVENGKKKISYAASMGIDSIPQEKKENIKLWLNNFDSISVREKRCISLLNDIVDTKIECVLDPTMLLDEKFWNNNCSNRLVDKPYLLCYFLGTNKNARKCAIQYAKQKGLQLVNIPVQDMEIIHNLGDRSIIASPSEFLSLIKHAIYIFTDSFHAIVFSHMFKKEVFIFQRDSIKSMSVRIENIVEMLGIEEHYCSTREKENISYITSVKNIDYSTHNMKYEQMLCNSQQFILKNLSSIENK